MEIAKKCLTRFVNYNRTHFAIMGVPSVHVTTVPIDIDKTTKAIGANRVQEIARQEIRYA